MNKISNISQLASIIRAQISSLGGVQKTKQVKKKIKQTEKKQGAHQPKEHDDLAELIAIRLNEISETDPNKIQKSFRIFLETVVMAELGKDLINDPRFFQMIDAVQQQMQEDAGLAVSIQHAMEILLSAKSKPL